MSKSVIEYRFLLVSPGDVAEEREAVVSVVADWNAQIGVALGARVETVRWESHSVPDMSGPAQEKINEQLLDDCDFAIGIFWHRIGTPTDRYESGSVEEIEKMREAGKRVLVYFSGKPYPQEALEITQLKRLQDLKSRFRTEGLLGGFSTTDDLRQQIQLHLTKVVSELLEAGRPGTSKFDQSVPVTLPRPDIRVKLSGAILPKRYGGSKQLLAVDVQNHSPVTVFLNHVRLRVAGERQFVSLRDAATGENQRRRELRPGESFSFHFSPEEILEELDPEDVISAAVKDDIDRLYESEAGIISGMLRTMMS